MNIISPPHPVSRFVYRFEILLDKLKVKRRFLIYSLIFTPRKMIDDWCSTSLA